MSSSTRSIAFVLLLGTAAISPQQAHAQSGVIAGTVVSASTGAPIPSVQVLLAGTTTGVITDGGGRFRIAGLSGETVSLDVRRLGFRPSRPTVRVGATDLRLTITEQSVSLDEVVVTGTAGGQARRELGNAVTTVNAADVAERGTINNVQQLLNGRAPGVVINPATGNVGTGARIRIRGASSLSLSNEPLIYIDGVRSNNQASSGPSNQAFGSASISRVNDLNPDDIESVEIIKGPAAVALLGAHAGISPRGRARTTSRIRKAASVSTTSRFRRSAEPQASSTRYRSTSSRSRMRVARRCSSMDTSARATSPRAAVPISSSTSRVQDSRTAREWSRRMA
jgi:outer membrane receptor protein involved in Fe transport